MNSKLSAEQALRLFSASDERTPPTRHSAQTDECHTFREFEYHVTGKVSFDREQRKHLNKCPYCQTTRSLFRKHYGINPIVIAAETLARVEEWVSNSFLMPREVSLLRGGGIASMLQAQGAARSHTYGVAVEDDSGQHLMDGRMYVTQGPLITPDGCLLMRISLELPPSVSERTPLELIFAAPSDGQVLGLFELPDLTGQLLKMKLPESLLAEARQQIESEFLLPFAVILRVSNPRLYAGNPLSHTPIMETKQWRPMPLPNVSENVWTGLRIGWLVTRYLIWLRTGKLGYHTIRKRLVQPNNCARLLKRSSRHR